jgi:hypothetical protein
MKIYTTDQLNDIFDALPESLRDTISSVNTSNKIESIRKKHQLHLDQAGELGSEIGYVLLGITPIKEFIRNIERRLNISTDDAIRIAKDVNLEIFNTIREHLKENTVSQDHSHTESVDSTKQTADTEESDGLNRDQILKEIEDENGNDDENEEGSEMRVGVGGGGDEDKLQKESRLDSPTIEPNNKDFLQGNIEGEKQPEKTPERELSNLAVELEVGGEKPTVNEMFEDKLNRPIKIESEKKEIKESIQNQEQQTYRGGGDPYREEIE